MSVIAINFQKPAETSVSVSPETQNAPTPVDQTTPKTSPSEAKAPRVIGRASLSSIIPKADWIDLLGMKPPMEMAESLTGLKPAMLKLALERLDPEQVHEAQQFLSAEMLETVTSVKEQIAHEASRRHRGYGSFTQGGHMGKRLAQQL
jgi:hypothetical protein